ncbi:MAG: glycosyltransferase family 9 protein [Lentisphaerae bacterium]|nr:glycosyltransferase family 9 protein [Lentisphaerota bacterium]
MNKSKKKILIYHCARIGDTIVTIPVLRNICRQNPNADIDIFNFQPGSSKYHLNLLEELGCFRKISFLSISFDLTADTWFLRAKNLLRFRRERYDAIYVFYICPPPSELWKKLFKFITGTKHLYVVDKTPSGMRISEFIRKQMENSGMPFLPEEATIRYPLLQKHLDKGLARYSELSIPEKSTPFVMGISGQGQQCMYWPVDRYQELLKRIIPKHNLFPVIIGAPDEKDVAEKLLSSCGQGAFVSDLQATEVIAFMKHFRFYLGNDTGTMHMADSAGIPCITLFADRDGYKYWWPEGEYHINILHRQKCEECRLGICPLGNPAPCIDSITVEEVEKAVDSMLKL